MAKLNNISKDEFMKLTKEEIYAILQGQLAKQPARDVNQRQSSRQGMKRSVKPKIKSVKEINEVFEARTMKASKDKPEVFNFKKKPVSLHEFREEEMKRAQVSGTAKDTTFQQLFDNRLKTMQPQTRIQITLYIDIMSDSLLIQKVFGPFKTTMPKLDKDDIYKFMIYTALRNNFTLLSAEYITAVGGRIIVYDKQFFKEHDMGKPFLETQVLSGQKTIRQTGENTCVIDYIWSQCRGRRGFKMYTFDEKNTLNLCEELQDYATNYPMMNTDEIIRWAKECHYNVSVYAHDAKYKKFAKYIANTRDISLAYIVKDHHIHSITDERLKIIATKANGGNCTDLWKYMSEIKWTRRHNQIKVFESIDEITRDTRDQIFVLPEDMKLEEVIDAYVIKTNYFVEYLNWNSRGVLDGFLDHSNNMYVLNDEYETGKSICDTLYAKYKIDDFVWTNQSYTALATSLFKQMCGFLPESQYNSKTQQLLDEFYPRALQWCSSGKQPEDLVNIGICKCYPSVLLNNNTNTSILSS